MQRNLTIFVCVVVCVGGLGQQYPFSRFTIDEGLSNNVVYSVHQDRKGFLWIATHNGLNRYDGYEFKKFLHRPFDKMSLAGNMTIDMAEDENGDLWILTNTHLHRYHEQNESFERYILPGGSPGHSNQSVSGLIHADKRFLLLNLVNGLFVFDKTGKGFRPVRVDAGTNERQDLFNLPFFKDKDGHVLIGAGAAKGVLAFDMSTMSFKRQLPPFYQRLRWRDKTVTSIYRNKNDNLVYCTQEGNKFFLESETGQKQFLLNRSIAGITVFIESIAEDQSGDIWIGYGNRLFEYLPAADSVIDLSGNLYNTSIRDNFIIKNICIDNFSNLWLGLYEAGVLKANIGKPMFLNFALNRTGIFRLPYSSIYGIIKRPDETVIVRYYGTQMASLIDISGKKILKREFKFNPDDSLAMKDLFPQFETIVSSRPFYQFFDATTRFTFNNGQFGLYKDRQRDYWTVNFNEFKRLKDRLTFNMGNHINCFYEDDDNTFWIGSDGNGMQKLNYKTRILKEFLPDESKPGSISSQYVDAIIPDEKKGLWLGTRDGLNYFDFETLQFKLLSVQDGLCDNTIYAMEKDKEGKLWLGTSNGLSCYDPYTKEFINYSKNNGLVNSEYNRNGTIALSNGWILMGGTEGIDIIIPDSIKFQKENGKKILSLLITSFKTSDSQYFSFDHPIQLTHEQNNVAISFSALDFTQPHNNKYLWKLEPVDKKWTYGPGKHEVNYSGLLPGNYSFKIKAAGADGIWNDKETTFSFVISEPWWQTWWLKSLIGALAIGILGMGVRLYYHRKLEKQLEGQKMLIEKQRAIENERSRIAADMHDDLGSGLTKIKYITDYILEKNDSGEIVQTELKKLRTFSSELLESMGEIIWAVSEKNNLLSSTLYYLRSYAANYCEENHMDCIFELPENFTDRIVSGNIRRNVFLLLKESLHNIVKHAAAKTVTIKVSVTEKLELIIKDDGKGFSPSDNRAGNGLVNMTKRVTELNGAIRFENNRGTAVIIHLPFTPNQSTID